VSKRLVVCVDDFALSPGVDAAVLELGAAGRISATSCLVGVPGWRAAAPALRELRGIDAGLHLDFTESPFDAGLRHSLRSFIARAYLGALPARRMAAEIRAQLDAFEDAMGRPPDHVDGHQHVHQLRGTAVPRGEPGTKPRVIAALGGPGLRGAALTGGLRMAPHLLGVYGFDADAAGYEALLARWLGLAADGDSLMCHPAAADEPAVPDPIARARRVEHAVLRSERWPALLAQAGVRVARFGAD
jgi:predicted glycoside hydrolase/deacetylase ChbG (UPF0249 family)